MSMLAEPRRKQKWSVDPRNSAWSNDDSKFGQKMLERMGWSKGKGLGRSEQGSTDHIKVKLKNNNHGLGVNASHEDNWIAHQDDFNELLAHLNDHHGQNTSNEVPPDEMKGFSLEEKSKTSKKRVHYTKFTKGKDLSSRSETDLNCIFGKRTKSSKNQEQESSRSESPVESAESGTRASAESKTETITKTVTSSLSMQEYFAQRMAQLKRSRSAGGSAASVKAEATETSSPAEEVGPVHSSSNDTEEPRKKKKKKNKKVVEDLEVVEEKCFGPIVLEEKENQEKVCSRKKKKRKTPEVTDENENSSSSSVLEMNCEEPRPAKKKKLKRTEKEQIIELEQTEEYIVIQDEEENSEVKECEEELVAKKSKKKKKKKKRQNQE
ncbi:PIN2/TERF1-interacting telomerase inhibitor 1 [Fundulus heteroclitus]|uniref:PIN2/TERF1-interacting telomerase inhibitor 1 n=1 Tax=Fundulus heteroclitus TaxID=8078 RepID=UPI00165A97BA|nr:PIN2/TERF1-interacting telomerase inhibitor 1 [Fundulus heteroclitus]